MKTLPLKVMGAALSLLVITAGAALALDGPAGPASELSASVQADIAEQLEARPGGVVVDNEIHYADGSQIVFVDPGTFSFSECGGSYFCAWAQPAYSGNVFMTSGQGVTVNLAGWVGQSYYNNRARDSLLYGSTGTTTCFESREMRPSISSVFWAPSQVTLGSGPIC